MRSRGRSMMGSYRDIKYYQTLYTKTFQDYVSYEVEKETENGVHELLTNLIARKPAGEILNIIDEMKDVVNKSSLVQKFRVQT